MSTLKPNGDAADWFGDRFKKFTAAYPHLRVTEDMVRVYAAGLNDLSPEDIGLAMARALKESVYFPVIAELRRYVKGSPEDHGLLAWSHLIEAASSVGAYMSLECDDLYAAAALKTVFGSWSAFCQTEAGPALHAKRAEFLAAYREARRALPATGEPTRLPGICEASGQYDRAPQVWCGRLTASGVVVIQREKPTLPAAAEAKQLRSGDSESTGGV